jgi:hypothetical protein
LPQAIPAHITLRLSNPSPTLLLTNIALEWELQVNSASRQKGTTGILTIAPLHATLVRLPVRWPGGDTNEIFLQLRYRQVTPSNGSSGSLVRTPPTTRVPMTQAGPVLSEEQLLLQAPAGNTPAVHPDGELTFTDENDTFTIHSPLIHIEFNKQTGWLQRYEANGAVLLTDTPVLKSNFWFAGTPGDTAAAWQEASHDPHLQLFSTSTGSTMIIVRAEYTLPATSCLLHISYTINSKGEMLVGQQVEADSTQKGWPLPCFGMRWLLPDTYDSIEYYGLGRTLRDSARPDKAISDSVSPGETLRDSIRLHAPWVGLYHDTIGSPSSPDGHVRNKAIISAIRWIRITGPNGKGLLITADSALINGRVLHNSPSVLLYIDSRQPAGGSIPGDNRQVFYGLPYGNYGCTYKVSPITSDHAGTLGHRP